jgi:hypothetical protein
MAGRAAVRRTSPPKTKKKVHPPNEPGFRPQRNPGERDGRASRGSAHLAPENEKKNHAPDEPGFRPRRNPGERDGRASRGSSPRTGPAAGEKNSNPGRDYGLLFYSSSSSSACCHDRARLMASASSCTSDRLGSPLLLPLLQDISSFSSSTPSSSIHSSLPLKKKKKGGVWGACPPLSSPLSSSFDRISASSPFPQRFRPHP